MAHDAFIFGNGQAYRIMGEKGVTPECPEAKYRKGDIVKVRRNKAAGHFPAELIVLVALPPHFSPDDALADLFGEPRPFMKRVGDRSITYILCREEDETIYYSPERNLLPSGKPPVEIGTVTRSSAPQ